MAMEPITSPTAAGPPASTVTGTLTPDSDTETPPTPQPRRPHNHRTHHHAPPHTAEVSYKECLKNHAASSGGHALDGCCEFMPGTTSLTCAACGCHRNFHRRDPDDPTPLHHLLPHAAARVAHSPPSACRALLSLSGRQSPSGPSDETDPRVGGYFFNGGQNGNRLHSSKKRFRTKFSQDQKEKMQGFAEKIGWRLRRGEERLVEEFCKNVGVRRGVFKVWMHNNKSTSSSSSLGSRRENEKVNQLRQLQHHSSSNGGSNNGNCAPVVYHEFYANGHGAQLEAQ